MFNSFFVDIDVSSHNPTNLTEVILRVGSDMIPKKGIMNVFSTNPLCSILVASGNYRCPRNAKFSGSSVHFKSSLFSQSLIIPIVNSSFSLPEGHEVAAYSFSSDPVKVRFVCTVRGCERQNIITLNTSSGCKLNGGGLFKASSNSDGYFHSFSLGKETCLSLNENWDSDVRVDMFNSLEDICAKDNDTKVHIMSRDVLVVLDKGRFCSGSWQGIYVCHFGKGGKEKFVCKWKIMTQFFIILISKQQKASVLAGSEAKFFKKTTISVRGRSRGIYPLLDLNKEVLDYVRRVKIGLIHFQILHTSASLAIGKKGSSNDMKADLNNVVKENMHYYRHTYEGSDDMPAHIKTSFLGPHVTLPIRDGQMVLGNNQELFFGEYRDHPRNRNIVVIIEGI